MDTNLLGAIDASKNRPDTVLTAALEFLELECVHIFRGSLNLPPSCLWWSVWMCAHTISANSGTRSGALGPLPLPS